MTSQTSFLPNSQLHIKINLLVDQYNDCTLLEQGIAQRVSQVIREIQTFSHIHPQPAREGLGKLLGIRIFPVPAQVLASMVSLFTPISVVYLSVQLNSEKITREEATAQANQIIERLKSLAPNHLAVAREGFGALLSFGIEEIQKKAAESLSELIAIETLIYDIKNIQVQELIDLESQVSTAINLCVQSNASQSLTASLFQLCEGIIERLWILSLLSEGASIIEENSRAILESSKKRIELLLKQPTQNEELNSFSFKIEKAIRRLTVKLSLQVSEKMRKLKTSFLEPPAFWNELGEIFSEMEDDLQAFFYYQKALEAIEILEKAQPLAKELKRLKGVIYKNMGTTSTFLGNYQTGIEFHHKQLKATIECLDQKEIGRAYCDLALAYFCSGTDTDTQKGFVVNDKGLKISLALPDLQGEAAAYRNLGTAFLLSGNIDEAIQNYKASLKIAGNLEDHILKRKLFRSLGFVYKESENYQEAIKYLKDGLQISIDYEDLVNQKVFYKKLGDSHEKIGEYAKAIEYYNEYLEIVTNLGDFQEKMQAYANLGFFCLKLEKYQEGKEFYFKYLDIATNLHHPIEGTVHGYIGFAYYGLEAYESAIAHFQKQLEKSGGLQEKSKAYCNLGRSNLFLGKKREDFALQELGASFYNKALSAIRDLKKQGSQEEGWIYGDFGNDCFEIGEYKKAVKAHKKSLEIARNKCSPQMISSAYGDLGRAYRSLGKYEKAIKCYKEDEEIASSLSDRPGLSKAKGNLGDVYTEIGAHELSIKYSEEQLEIGNSLDNQHDKASAYLNLGVAHFYLGKYEKAIEDLENCLAVVMKFKVLDLQWQANLYLAVLYRGVKNSDRRANVWYEKVSSWVKLLESGEGDFSNPQKQIDLCYLYGAKLWDVEEYKKAIELHQSCLEIVKRINDRNGEGHAHVILGNNYRLLQNYIEAARHYESAIGVFSEIQKELKSDQWKITIFEKQSKAYRGAEKTCILQGEYEKALENSEHRRARALNQKLEEKIFQKSFPSLSIKQIQSLAVAQNTIFIVYTEEAPVNISVWVIHPDAGRGIQYDRLESSGDFKVKPSDRLKYFPYKGKGAHETASSPAADFLELASDLVETEVKGRKYAERQKEKDQELEAKRAAFRQQLRSWYDMLIAPIEQHLPQSQDITLTILPDSDLATLPFALFQDQEEKYLIEKYPIAIAPSIQTLALLSERKGQTELPQQFTIVSMPSNPAVPAIRSSAKEIAAIKKTFLTQGEISLLSQQEATVSNVLEKAQGSRFLHVDCHGKADLKFDPHSVYEGGLYLTPEEGGEQTEFRKPGCLYAEQISQISLNAELAVLSACHSGRGKVQREGVVGLPHAFLAAGALSVVATHWELPANDLTISIFKAFYSHILGTSKIAQARGGPLNKAQALREAMLLGIAQERGKPELWGSLFLTGIS